MPINKYGNLDFPKNPNNNDVYIDSKNIQWLYNGIEWAIFEPYYINDLSDVSITNIEIGHILFWSGIKWGNKTNVKNIYDLSDVSLNIPQDNQFSIWDGTNWINKIPDDLDMCSMYLDKTSINISGLILFDTIKYDKNNNMVDIILSRINIKKQSTYNIIFTYNVDFAGQILNLLESIQFFDKNDIMLDEVYTSSSGYNGTENRQNSIQMFKNLNVDDYILLYNYGTGSIIDIVNLIVTVEQI